MKWPFGKDTSQTQKGGAGNTQNIGMDPALFVAEMKRKDARIDQLIKEKEALLLEVSQLEQRKLRDDLTKLRSQKQGLEARIAQPEQAFAEHKQRASQIEDLLQDAATSQAVGENRITSALKGFEHLEYDEIDALLDETARRGIMLAANAYFGKGLIAEDAVKWHDAYTHYKRAADLSDDLDHLAAYAHMTWRLAKGAEAVTVNEQLAARVKADFGPESSEYASCLNNLAILVQSQGRLTEAEELYRKALAIHIVTIGEMHPDYATHLNNLARVVEDQGRLAEAEGLYGKALSIHRATIGEVHPQYATHLNNLAGLVQSQGRFSEAEELYRKVLAIDHATIGPNHPDYAIHLNNFAILLAVTDRLVEARPLFEQALGILRTTLPADHPQIAVLEQSLADLPNP